MMKSVSQSNSLLPYFHPYSIIIIIIIIEGLSLLQSIPPTTANKQTQSQKKRGSMARKLLGPRTNPYSIHAIIKK